MHLGAAPETTYALGHLAPPDQERVGLSKAICCLTDGGSDLLGARGLQLSEQAQDPRSYAMAEIALMAEGTRQLMILFLRSCTHLQPMGHHPPPWNPLPSMLPGDLWTLSALPFLCLPGHLCASVNLCPEPWQAPGVAGGTDQH